MPVRAKFICTSVTKGINWNTNRDRFPFLYTYRFSPVTGNGSDENKSFYASTPTGSVEIGAIGHDLFEPGREYYLDFTLA